MGSSNTAEDRWIAPMRDVTLPLTGGCLCGACRYELRAAPLTVYACHCADCQRQSGSAFGMTMIAARNAFFVTAGQPATVARTRPSGRISAIRFCATCGSRLFAEPNPQFVGIRPGTLDDTSWVKPAMRYWVRSGHDWAYGADETTHETQPDDISVAIRLWHKQGLKVRDLIENRPSAQDIRAAALSLERLWLLLLW